MTTLVELDRILLVLLLLVRASGLVLVAPLFGDKLVPARIKAALTVALAVVMFPLAPRTPPVPDTLIELALLAGAELTIGIALGFLARLLLLSFEMAGQIVAIQMGFAIASTMDPMTGHRSNIVGRWLWILAMLLFLHFGGHHLLLRALAASLDLVPAGRGLVSGEVVASLTALAAGSIRDGLRIAIPMMGVQMLTMLGLGILARTVPQMNVFIVGFPIKIAMGIIALIVALPFVAQTVQHEVGLLGERLLSLVAAA